jgi:hypothetical protein
MALWLFVAATQALAYYTGVPLVLAGLGLLLLTGTLDYKENGVSRKLALLPEFLRRGGDQPSRSRNSIPPVSNRCVVVLGLGCVSRLSLGSHNVEKN